MIVQRVISEPRDNLFRNRIIAARSYVKYRTEVKSASGITCENAIRNRKRFSETFHGEYVGKSWLNYKRSETTTQTDPTGIPSLKRSLTTNIYKKISVYLQFTAPP